MLYTLVEMKVLLSVLATSLGSVLNREVSLLMVTDTTSVKQCCGSGSVIILYRSGSFHEKEKK
jgi:hypothetical protein